MNIYSARHLDKKTYSDIRKLIHFCTVHDNISEHIFFEEDINAVCELPAYYIATDGTKNSVIGYMGVFIPDRYSCEVYCYVHPNYRRQHVFTGMFSLLKENLKNSDTDTIYFVSAPDSVTAAATSLHLHACHEPSDFILINSLENNKIYSCSSDALHIERNISADDDSEVLLIINDNTCIGECGLFYSGSYATIYGFEIYEKYRSLGFGRTALNTILDYLNKKNISDVILHVTESNKAACHLYMTNGFRIKEQTDYYSIKI